MTVPRPTIKDQKVSGGTILGNRPFPKIVGIILPFISLWSYPAYKNWQPHTLVPLAFWDGPHSVWCVSPMASLTFRGGPHCLWSVFLPWPLAFQDGPHCVYRVCISLENLLSLYYGSLLNSFLCKAKNQHSAGLGTWTWPGCDHPLAPHTTFILHHFKLLILN